MKLNRRLKNILLSFDQLIFVLITFGAAYPDETISAAAWRLEQKGHFSGRIFRPLIDFIFANLPFGFAAKNHCKTAYESELYNRQLPPEYSA